MARYIPDVLDHMAIFPPAIQRKLTALDGVRFKRDMSFQPCETLRLPQKDYDTVIAEMQGSGFDVGRGVKVGRCKLLPSHPLSASRNIPDIIKARDVFNGRAQDCVAALTNALPYLPRNKVHVYQSDYALIDRQLADSGFDTSRGIKADGVELIPILSN